MLCWCGTLGLDEAKAVQVEQLWKHHYLNLSEATSEQTLMVNELVDIDWQFGGDTLLLVALPLEW